LASKFGYYQITQSQFGGVVKHINENQTGNILVPKFPDELQKDVDALVQNAARLREEATEELSSADKLLKEKSGLCDLSSELYDYFGHRSNLRKVSCFTRNIQDIGTTTINAFNHSERIRKMKDSITCSTIPLKDVLKGGRTYGTSGLPNIEVKPGHGIMLINQKDMFDNIVKGKWISSRGSDPENVLEYGEILIACDGTLGENELFCRAIFANEDLKGSYVSSHFLRLKVNDAVPVGYLYCWLNSDYGFRLIRNTQAGTKLCHPINKLFLDIPVPIINEEEMRAIDVMVKEAFTKRHQANQKELKAIAMVEEEIEKWNK
jgi:restriction endonuclease S subunit